MAAMVRTLVVCSCWCLMLEWLWQPALTQQANKDYDDGSCGMRVVAREGLIKGGYPTRPGDWPWHVALYQRGVNSQGFEYACGGSLVHKYLVVTAAHCVTYTASKRRIPTGDILLKMGKFNLSNDEELHSEDYHVIESIVHQEYNPTTFENDMAILRVELPVIFTDYIRPVCIWKRDDGYVLPEVIGSVGTVVGWGLTDENKVSTVLNEAKMPVVDSHTCLASDRTFFGRLLYSKAFCAGYQNGTGVCNGDSGGGIFFQYKNQWYLKGLVSFSNTIDSTGVCNLKLYIGFADASLYVDWLYEHTPNEANGDPILGHPNIRLINQGNCGKNKYIFNYQEDRKPAIGQYPWMVTLRHPFQNPEYVPCNGVLLNRNYVLTTTCVDLQDEIVATLGDYHTGTSVDCVDTNVGNVCLTTVQSISIGQLYVKDKLVLARLTIPAVIGRREHIEAICLPVGIEQRDRLYNRYILTGWKESGQDSKVLQRILVDAIDQNVCRKEMNEYQYASDESKNVTDAIICVRNVNNATRSPQCNDYQPGTAIQAIDKKSNRYVVYGLQTGISYCSKPERFIAISKYLVWILDNIRG